MAFLTIIAWHWFAPLEFGGQTAYVIVDGISMEPNLHRGDLVVIRRQAHYEVGDVVAYQNPIVDKVIHRIIGRNGGRYILQGDNNHWRDSYQPTIEDIIGKRWFHISGAGNIFLWFRRPLGFALLAGTTGVMVLMMKISRSEHEPAATGNQASWIQKHREDVLLLLFVIGAASIFLGIAAFTKPLTIQESDEIKYEHSGTFYYESPPVSADLYEEGRALSGDPVYRRLSDAIYVQFDYTFDVPEGSQDVELTTQLNAILSEPNGWRRQLEISPQQRYSQNQVALSGELAFSDLVALIENWQDETGIQRDVFFITLAPTIIVEGTLDGHPFYDRFTPELELSMDHYQLAMIKGGAIETDDLSLLLEPHDTRALQIERTVPNALLILGLELPVRSARYIASMGLLIALVGAGGVVYVTSSKQTKETTTHIQLKYAHLIVEVEGIKRLSEAGTIVRVKEFDALVSLAERHQTDILHVSRGQSQRYMVQTSDCIYFYEIAQISTNPPDEQC